MKMSVKSVRTSYVIRLFAVTAAVTLSTSNVHADRFPGASIGSEVLQRDVYTALEPLDGASRPDCKVRGMKIVDTEIVTPPPVNAKVVNGVIASGNWLERWSVQNSSCGGEVIKYLVSFDADGQGGAYFGIRLDK